MNQANHKEYTKQLLFFLTAQKHCQLLGILKLGLVIKMMTTAIRMIKCVFDLYFLWSRQDLPVYVDYGRIVGLAASGYLWRCFEVFELFQANILTR